MTTQLVPALFFSPSLNPEIAQQRFKKLATVLHPDTPTGDLSLMQRLNAEFDAFKAGRLQVASAAPPSPPPQPTYTNYRADLIRRAGDAVISRIPMYLKLNVIFTTSTSRERVEASGPNTFEYKDDLKDLGFRWDKAEKTWYYEVRI